MDELIAWFEGLGPVMAALVATLFTWGMTTAAAALVFPFRTMNRRLFDGMLGFTGGVMVAASFWSLLAPAIDMVGGEGAQGGKTHRPFFGPGSVHPSAVLGSTYREQNQKRNLLGNSGMLSLNNRGSAPRRILWAYRRSV